MLFQGGMDTDEDSAVTNALSGLVGVGGLFVMGGGLLPHTVPQVLGAASVFLANLSECLLLLLIRGKTTNSHPKTSLAVSLSPNACSISSDDQQTHRSTPGCMPFQQCSSPEDLFGRRVLGSTV
jgi:hypothetical protein